MSGSGSTIFCLGDPKGGAKAFEVGAAAQQSLSPSAGTAGSNKESVRH